MIGDNLSLVPNRRRSIASESSESDTRSISSSNTHSSAQSASTLTQNLPHRLDVDQQNPNQNNIFSSRSQNSSPSFSFAESLGKAFGSFSISCFKFMMPFYKGFLISFASAYAAYAPHDKEEIEKIIKQIKSMSIQDMMAASASSSRIAGNSSQREEEALEPDQLYQQESRQAQLRQAERLEEQRRLEQRQLEDQRQLEEQWQLEEQQRLEDLRRQ